MNYAQAVSYIHSLLQFGIKPGLERMKALLEELGNPQEELQFIHVAGTNGKGSTCTMLSNVLREAGYRVGLFTSPYVVDFCERFQINGVMITHEDLAQQVQLVQPAVEKLVARNMQPTEFEVITAIAFCYFRMQHCQVVVLEVGLGGRFDSTNVIHAPLVSVLTSISFDHMNILGNTMTEISTEKCGIIKFNGHVVSYPAQHQDAMAVIKKTCHTLQNTLSISTTKSLSIVSSEQEGSHFIYKRHAYFVPMMGVHQVYNALVVIDCCKLLSKMQLKLPRRSIEAGIAKTVLPARMELLSVKPPVLLDGGHNTDCANSLQAVLQQQFKGKRILGLMGIMQDKEHDKYLARVAPQFARILTVAPNNDRALPAQLLAEEAQQYCANAEAFQSVASAVEAAKKELPDYDALIVCGSFYLASDVRALFQNGIQ